MHDPLVVGVGHRVADRDELLEQAAEPQARRPGSRREDSSPWKASIASWRVWPSMKGMV